MAIYCDVPSRTSFNYSSNSPISMSVRAWEFYLPQLAALAHSVGLDLGDSPVLEYAETSPEIKTAM